MSGSFSCITQDRLRQLSDIDLSPQEWTELEDHVTDCVHCRAVMDEIAADPDWHQQLRQAFCCDKDRDGRPSPDGLASEDAQQEGDGPHQRLLALLGATDNPRMLGRIGPY